MSDPDIRMTDDVDVVVRRTPRFGTFLLLGVLLGFIAAGVLVVLPVDTSVLTSDYSLGATMALLMLLLGLVGAALGLSVALILDRVNAKRARTYTVRGEYVARKAPAAPEFGENGNAAAASADDRTADGADGSAPAADGEQEPNGDVEQ
ncbi:MAG: hypothetical protein ACTHVY_08000 [Brevibacterium yomogidense]|uniref:Uncharacterized protein n=1 Tax=Brevibacterium yomogidense TaxID=946573 RepID=A0A1X6XNP5_9MICO|nr:MULTISPECIES: hypothetical protein [Brevibacterium]SLN00758.1 hypothetical protein FM105_13465 [Brevibacterium yomogidense]SMX73633.1 hypothetical protein BSP109_01024 [Brevibacterium sp. Mu109]